MTNDIDYNQLGKRIKRYRLKAHFTQEQLAEKTDVATSTIAHAENGTSKPSLPLLLKIANALNVTLDQLVCDSLPVIDTYIEKDIADLIAVDDMVVTLTHFGYVKRLSKSIYKAQNRGGKGVTAHKLGDKTGYLTGVATVDENDDLMMITDQGTLIRISVSGIPTYSRTAGGVIVMRLTDGAKLVNFTKVQKEEETEEGDAPAEEETVEA